MARQILRHLFNDELASGVARHAVGPTLFMEALNREKHALGKISKRFRNPFALAR